MDIQLDETWKMVLRDELREPYVARLLAFVRQERELHPPIYPPQELVFNAFNQTPYDKVRVVIVGQDPYHGPNQAHGLCFSVPKGVDAPPSLKNIFKELHADLGLPIPSHGCLEKWAQQGVLLLNATLTVRESSPLSHHKKGWERFTDAVIQKISDKKEPVIFLLWGKNAEKKCATISPHHIILKAAHPSPLSAYNGFLGCKHFSEANSYLDLPIDWSL